MPLHTGQYWIICCSAIVPPIVLYKYSWALEKKQCRRAETPSLCAHVPRKYKLCAVKSRIIDFFHYIIYAPRHYHFEGRLYKDLDKGLTKDFVSEFPKLRYSYIDILIYSFLIYNVYTVSRKTFRFFSCFLQKNQYTYICSSCSLIDKSTF